MTEELILTWEDCAAAGMTMAEAARHRNMTRASATQWAKRHPEVKFVRKPLTSLARWQECADAGMTKGEAAEHLGRTYDAAIRAERELDLAFTPFRDKYVSKVRLRSIGRGPRSWLLLLTPEQVQHYRALVRNNYRRIAALADMGINFEGVTSMIASATNNPDGTHTVRAAIRIGSKLHHFEATHESMEQARETVIKQIEDAALHAAAAQLRRRV